ncbi:MAG: Arc family DNA-binding protein [Methylocystis sp.]|uniref:Arc family DNA-binding protein n=1 Tax=Methylocystis sp. TaxID=1911079 RepID=UPI003DA30748
MTDEGEKRRRPWDRATPKESGERPGRPWEKTGPESDDKDETHMRIRVPGALRQQLIALAEQNGRSLNAEVVARLVASLRDNRELEDVVRLADYHGKRLDNLENAMRDVFARLLPGERFFKPKNRED